ncbi:Lrp/AsnC family transcriptional regulator [Thermogladius sp. KZ2Tp1]|uniref:Lrp/AsnC family transcriptional regulator n=1 Tax=Thermogladius sp. KZ2Tp1 TaxID=3136289 RepID=UPI003DA9BEA4
MGFQGLRKRPESYPGLLDEVDKKILEILREDSKRRLKDIAYELAKPVSTVHERVARLVRAGVIRRFTVEVDYSKLGYTVKALILLNVDGKHILDVESDISRHQNVEAVYDITGEFDVAVIASFKSISELDEFVKWLLKHPYIKQSRTSIIFRVAKEEKRLPL